MSFLDSLSKRYLRTVPFNLIICHSLDRGHDHKSHWSQHHQCIRKVQMDWVFVLEGITFCILQVRCKHKHSDQRRVHQCILLGLKHVEYFLDFHRMDRDHDRTSSRVRPLLCTRKILVGWAPSLLGNQVYTWMDQHNHRHPDRIQDVRCNHLDF